MVAPARSDGRPPAGLATGWLFGTCPLRVGLALSTSAAERVELSAPSLEIDPIVSSAPPPPAPTVGSAKSVWDEWPSLTGRCRIERAEDAAGCPQTEREPHA